MQNNNNNGEISTGNALPYLMGNELRKTYGSDFANISMSSWTGDHILSFGDKKVTESGNYIEPQFTDMLSLEMLNGSRSALKDGHSIILSASAAKALFGSADPSNKVIKVDNKFDLTVSGVYKDLPLNSDFNNVAFMAPWQLYIDQTNWQEKATSPWRNNSFQVFVQLSEHADIATVSRKISDVKLKMIPTADLAQHPQLFLQPMSKWHLHSEFKNGVNTGGRIAYVWLFGTIGVFVLLLACINFMNLSTARSEKRAKEVGIRKAVGSLRGQLISQFFCESILVALFSFACAIVIVKLLLPFFNEVAGKQIHILWTAPLFWLLGVCFALFTGLVAGIYPALYLSSFNPVKVLKGTFKAGPMAAIPRKVLVVVQFTVSVILIIGTIVVYRQVEFAMNRPVGYSRAGLITVPVVTEDVHKNFNAISDELKSSGVVAQLAETSSPATDVYDDNGGFNWKGKDLTLQADFATLWVTTDFGKTVGFHIKDGRDFSRDFATDTAAMILNEAAATFIGLKQPIGETVTMNGKPYHVVGVIKDMVMQSPYQPVYRTIIVNSPDAQPVVAIRLNPNSNSNDALTKIAAVFKKYNPSQPFTYHFADEQYARKFNDELRIGQLANFFTILAIFISCLGLYGMATFMAEQRTKEIGVRKILGASVLGLWGLLSKDFIILVGISLLIASPVSWYFMHNWLQSYTYRTEISWWIFTVTAAGAILITILTVSYQSLKAATTNPVKSLKAN
jgi:ABC-type antimicrobial peptide transport system permease subunit